MLELVGNAGNLPRWAPAFAPSVRRDGADWLIGDGGSPARIRVRVAQEQGTVDIVSAEDPRRGAFLRALPNADGSERVFTLFFAPDADQAAVDAQMSTVEAELETVRTLCAEERSGATQQLGRAAAPVVRRGRAQRV